MSPDVAREALACLSCFLGARNEATYRLTKTSSQLQRKWVQEEDSQDSYAELFDDVDLDDPALARALDIGTQSEAAAASVELTTPVQSDGEKTEACAVRQRDRQFTELAACRLIPALFRYITNSLHPDRNGGKAYVLAEHDNEEWVDSSSNKNSPDEEGDEQRHVLATAIDLWVSLASVAVSSTDLLGGSRSWLSYFRVGGRESFKNLSNGIHKREVGLRFLWNVLKILEKQQREGERCEQAVELSAELWSIWFASMVAKRSSSILSDFTAMLARRDGTLFEGVTVGDTDRTEAAGFDTRRLGLLQGVLGNMNKVLTRNDQDKVMAQCFIGGLTSLLSSLRTYVNEAVASTTRSHILREQQCDFQINSRSNFGGTKAYVKFCARVLYALESKVEVEGVQRAIRIEMGRTRALVERAQETVTIGSFAQTE